MRLANLGGSHSHRFQRLGELGDLEKAIGYQSRAVSLCPEGHPYFSIVLANLGVSHSRRFQRLGELSDLEKAMECESRAVALTPEGHPYLPDRLQNLGISYSHRFLFLHNQGDLSKVIEYMSCALNLTPDDHPNSSCRYFPLAGFRLLQYHQSRDPSCLRDSLHSYRMASQSLACSPHYRFRYAIGWPKQASHEVSVNPIEAYQTAIDILPQFIWLGATMQQRYQDLSIAKTLAADAAFAVTLALDFSLALEWLEHARCVVWNQSLMLRSPLDQLHVSNPGLAARLQDVANRLHDAGSQSRESWELDLDSLTTEQVAQKHRQLAKEYTDLIVEARMLPGFEDFLRPLKVNELFRAARYGPVVVINCHKERSDALIVIPGEYSSHQNRSNRTKF